MPRNTTTTDRVERSLLPEFLRSAAIGAVIAEALDNHNVVGETASGAVTSMIGDAAREIRVCHGLPHPDDVPVNDLPFRFERGFRDRNDGIERTEDGWDRNDPAENAEAQA